MKKDKLDKAINNTPQKGEDIKKGMPEKNAMTDSVKNTALQEEGLNQTRTTRDDLMPSDGDNLTNG